MEKPSLNRRQSSEKRRLQVEAGGLLAATLGAAGTGAYFIGDAIAQTGAGIPVENPKVLAGCLASAALTRLAIETNYRFGDTVNQLRR